MEKTAEGNEGVVKTLAETPYAIGHVGISYAGGIGKADLAPAMIKNQSGKFLLPTPQTIAAGAAKLDPRTPPYERISLVFAPGDDSYPLVNDEYVVVSKTQPVSSAVSARRRSTRSGERLCKARSQSIDRRKRCRLPDGLCED